MNNDERSQVIVSPDGFYYTCTAHRIRTQVKKVDTCKIIPKK